MDQALAQMFPDYSRSRLKAWLMDGAVLVDGEKLRPRDRVDGDEEVVLRALTEVAAREDTFANREIVTRHLALGHRPDKGGVRGQCLGNQHQSGRAFVKPMNDACPR